MTDGPPIESRAQLIPPHDSASLLQALRSPESPERAIFREQIVGALKTKLEERLMNLKGNNVRFTDKDFRDSDAIVPAYFHTLGRTNNCAYILRDPRGFFDMLQNEPEKFAADCLTIIPVTIMWTMRDLLIQRGHNQAKVDALLRDMIIAGDETQLRMNRKLYMPFLIIDSKKELYEEREHNDGRDNQIVTLSTRTQGDSSIDVPYHDSITGPIRTNIRADRGDLYYTESIGLNHREDFGNADSQNGIVLKGRSSTSGEGVDDSVVFAHTNNVLDRRMTLSGVIDLLLQEATRADRNPPVDIDEFIQRGGICYEVVRFDYVGLYEAMARQLNKGLVDTTYNRTIGTGMEYFRYLGRAIGKARRDKKKKAQNLQ